MKLLTAILISFMLLITNQPAKIKLEATPQTLKPGESTTIHWQAKGYEKVYISGLGSVNEPMGDKQVTLEKTTTYIMLAESATDLQSASLQVVVEGSRDASSFDYNAYGYQYMGEHNSPLFTTFYNQIQTVLQDNLKLSVEPSIISMDKTYRFTTNTSERLAKDLFGEEAKFRARRLSYLVELERDEKSKKVKYTIKTRIEHIRRNSSTWENDASEDLHQNATDKLKTLIDKLSS